MLTIEFCLRWASLEVLDMALTFGMHTYSWCFNISTYEILYLFSEYTLKVKKKRKERKKKRGYNAEIDRRLMEWRSSVVRQRKH